MSYDDAIEALSKDALRFVKNNTVLGLGSGRAATAFVKELGVHIKKKKMNVRAVPTSLQIKLVAERAGIHLVSSDQIEKIDTVFDGADQIDGQRNLIKGGGGALLRENILISCANQVIIMADATKFVRHFNRTVPVEIHPFARNTAKKLIEDIGGKPEIRTIERGYPFITENGNIIYDCDFGTIKAPAQLASKIKLVAGVVEVGIFTRKPDIIYKANENGKFEILR
ncbi:MAG: ribose-5-phosphate isomerase RpiA [Candidatus Nitrosotenuis sp.]|uniref:Ribose 5-phosphate isomerase A n=1 Tax=Candidatus Nitrosotenuis uzonensis TaxID=1407055 RepID=A0A812EW55_9ARCH|nr:ribose-5-phosphate isomerase RpiA [Candidatus Nitrosotenuis uzonensis]CAE6493242.1 putative Ribose 5-phosphate isomerase A (Phosphoriboisomerase A) [Candidatus Nitrosotenuis uzonensis]